MESIALRIAGTKQRRTGFAPLFNYGVIPQAEAEFLDRATVVDEKPVFVVRNTSEFLLYSLVDRKVKAFDAETPGILCIVLKIGRNVQFANKVSPYTVLMDVYDMFRQKYMKQQDDGYDKYLDIPIEEEDIIEVLRKYAQLERVKRKMCVMMDSGPTGILQVQKSMMKAFFLDTQYAIFCKYRDIEVGSECETSSPLKDIKIKSGDIFKVGGELPTNNSFQNRDEDSGISDNNGNGQDGTGNDGSDSEDSGRSDGFRSSADDKNGGKSIFEISENKEDVKTGETETNSIDPDNNKKNGETTNSKNNEQKKTEEQKQKEQERRKNTLDEKRIKKEQEAEERRKELERLKRIEEEKRRKKERMRNITMMAIITALLVFLLVVGVNRFCGGDKKITSTAQVAKDSISSQVQEAGSEGVAEESDTTSNDSSIAEGSDTENKDEDEFERKRKEEERQKRLQSINNPPKKVDGVKKDKDKASDQKEDMKNDQKEKILEDRKNSQKEKILEAINNGYKISWSESLFDKDDKKLIKWAFDNLKEIKKLRNGKTIRNFSDIKKMKGGNTLL